MYFPQDSEKCYYDMTTGTYIYSQSESYSAVNSPQITSTHNEESIAQFIANDTMVQQNVEEIEICTELSGTSNFNNLELISNNKPSNANGKKYNCDECSESFRSSHERTMHKIQNHEDRRYKAPKGKKRIAKTEEQKKNFDKKPKKYPPKCFQCEKCDEFFMQKNDLVKHDRNKHTGNGEYPCPDCSKIFYTYDMFIEHRDLHDDSIPKYDCSACDKKFLSQRKLKEHSVIHQERTFFKCEVCGKVFVRSQTLQYHRITCRAAYACDRCVDSFMTQDGLDKHKTLHDIAPDKFTCKKCNKIFPDSWTLKNHEKRHTLRMNYTCCICREIISTRAIYQKHLKCHIESNLKCPDCGQQFNSLVKYGYHKAEHHSNMKPYDCLLCSDVFCTRHELFSHLLNHNDSLATTNSSPMVCEECGLQFTLKNLLESHKEKFHNKTSVLDDNNKNSDLGKRKRIESIPPTEFVTCENCAQIFENDQALQFHQQFCFS